VIDARAETTWVPGAFQLWVGGSQWRAPGAPPQRGHDVVDLNEGSAEGEDARGVAVQVAFVENPNFETSFSLYRLKG
jgi:hypothetical protein